MKAGAGDQKAKNRPFCLISRHGGRGKRTRCTGGCTGGCRRREDGR